VAAGRPRFMLIRVRGKKRTYLLFVNNIPSTSVINGIN